MTTKDMQKEFIYFLNKKYKTWEKSRTLRKLSQLTLGPNSRDYTVSDKFFSLICFNMQIKKAKQNL